MQNKKQKKFQKNQKSSKKSRKKTVLYIVGGMQNLLCMKTKAKTAK